jgi:hypothetical protein
MPDVCLDEIGKDSPLYFDIDRTVTRAGIPQLNVGREPTTNSSGSEGTTVTDFLERYFFPDQMALINLTPNTATAFEYQS